VTGAVADVTAVEVVDEEGRPPSAWRTIVGSIEGKIGLVVGALMLGTIVFGRFFAPYEPDELGVGTATIGPSADHLFGTDRIGRDVLSRVIVGARSVLVIALLATLLGTVLGTTIGLVYLLLERPFPALALPRGIHVELGGTRT
jgi:ABC-type dipeptide/oligopeptide/nickel transport system permease subunit